MAMSSSTQRSPRGWGKAISSSNAAPVTAAISRARPRIDRQSGRLGVTSTSSTRSAMGKWSMSSSPTCHSSGSSMVPALLAARPSSASERIIPEDGTPRSLASLMRVPSGSTPPGSTTATVWPAATFGAPHTMVRGAASPTSTVHTDSLSASGWRPHSSTFPTTKHLRFSASPGTPASLTRSTSVPVMARREASSSTSIWMST